MKDEWIKSLYRSDKDNEEVIPASVDASILEQACLAQTQASQRKPLISRVRPYGWIYGTAASAILGIMLVLQIPETTDLQSLLTKVEQRQADSSEFVAMSQEEASLEAEANTDASTIAPFADSVGETPTYARRVIQKPTALLEKARAPVTEEFKETPPAILLRMAPAIAPKTKVLPAAIESFSALAGSKLSTNCARLNAYFLHAVEKQVILQCETDKQLSFQFEDKSITSCNSIFRFTLGSTAVVSIRKRKSESVLEEIQINHAGKLYSLHCSAKQWVLAEIVQP